MKKTLCFILLAVVIAFGSSVFAASKEDVISAIKSTYTIGDDTFKLPSSLIKKAESYLKKNELTEEQYSNILNNINGMVGIAQKNGTLDPNQISVQDKMKAFDLIADTSKNANIDLDKALEENNIVIEVPVTKPVEEKKSENVSNEPSEAVSSQNSNVSDEQKEDDTKEETSKEEEKDDSTKKPTQTINLSEMLTNKDTSESSDNSKSKAKMVNEEFNKYVTYGVVGATCILFVNFLIIYLIFKSKWNRIIKYILIVIFVLLVLVILAALVYILIRLEDIRAVYKLYYIFK